MQAVQPYEALDPSAKEVPSCWANDVMPCQPLPEMQVLSARAEHGENAVESKQQPEWRKIARRYLDWVSLLIVSDVACHAYRRASCSACALLPCAPDPCASLRDSTRHYEATPKHVSSVHHIGKAYAAKL